MATLATFDFTGTNGATWPTGWTTAVSGTDAATTNNANRGALTSNTTAYGNGAKAYLTGITATTDLDVTLDITFPVIVEQYLHIDLRAADSASAVELPATSYVLQVFPGNGTATVGVSKRVNGVGAGISGDLTTGAWVANTARRIRFSAIGDTLAVKVWDPAASEPAAWLWIGTDTALTAATGSLFLMMSAGGEATARTVYIDNVTVTDGSSAPALSAANITATATLEPRRWTTTLPTPARTGTLEPRRWAGTL